MRPFDRTGRPRREPPCRCSGNAKGYTTYHPALFCRHGTLAAQETPLERAQGRETPMRMARRIALHMVLVLVAVLLSVAAASGAGAWRRTWCLGSGRACASCAPT